MPSNPTEHPQVGPSTTALLIDAKKARVLLCLGKTRLWVLTNCNAIPSYKIGGSVRYSPAELKAWIACGCPTEGGAAVRVRKATIS